MTFTPNPFDQTGTVDTSNYGLPGDVAIRGNAGTAWGADGPSAYGGGDPAETTADTSAAQVCSAFFEDTATLETAAGERLQPDQRMADRTY